MKYVHNAERERIASKVWEPHFFVATFKEELTGDERSIMLHTCTGLQRHGESIAEKYMNEGETLKGIREIPRREYEYWLCGSDVVEINGLSIPSKFVTEYLIADDLPTAEKQVNKYGDLSRKRVLLMERDENLLQSIAESFEKASPENDVVREEEDVKPDSLDKYYKEYLD